MYLVLSLVSLCLLFEKYIFLCCFVCKRDTCAEISMVILLLVVTLLRLVEVAEWCRKVADVSTSAPLVGSTTLLPNIPTLPLSLSPSFLLSRNFLRLFHSRDCLTYLDLAIQYYPLVLQGMQTSFDARSVVSTLAISRA